MKVENFYNVMSSLMMLIIAEVECILATGAISANVGSQIQLFTLAAYIAFVTIWMVFESVYPELFGEHKFIDKCEPKPMRQICETGLISSVEVSE